MLPKLFYVMDFENVDYIHGIRRTIRVQEQQVEIESTERHLSRIE